MSLQFRERFTDDFDRINDHLNQSGSRKKRTTKTNTKRTRKTVKTKTVDGVSGDTEDGKTYDEEKEKDSSYFETWKVPYVEPQ